MDRETFFPLGERFEYLARIAGYREIESRRTVMSKLLLLPPPDFHYVSRFSVVFLISEKEKSHSIIDT